MYDDSRMRLCGVLSAADRDFVLKARDGNIWRFRRTFEAGLLEGRQVTLEGVRVGLDRLAVDWMGELPAFSKS